MFIRKLQEFVENNFWNIAATALVGQSTLQVRIRFGESCHGVENKSGHSVSLYMFIFKVVFGSTQTTTLFSQVYWKKSYYFKN